jgi:hypothetical protein
MCEKGKPRHDQRGRLPNLTNHFGRYANFAASNLVAASDLLHTPVIAPDRHCSAAGASEAALVAVATVSAVMTPTVSAGVNSNAAGAYVHI